MLKFWLLIVLFLPLFLGCGYEIYTEPLPKSSSSDAVSSSSSSVVASSNSTNEFLDDRDGKIYKYVIIGTQTWMAENMRYETSDIKCYGNNHDNCEIFGMLYDWNTAKIICPVGWHLPSDAEWNKLRDFVGSNVGTKLKANSYLWISGKGTDDFGFNALPGGFHKDYFLEIREVSGFWSATTGSSFGSAHVRYLKYNNESLNLAGFYISNGLANVRCIKDN
ncbi:MAG: fibrobacter succinogenes major paralogous domain-containing protein [Fibromonadales bacterium]|nr:fibrobacter succinogenes major paralogous domain-containing protein [Fibromonadales bacterium]